MIEISGGLNSSHRSITWSLCGVKSIYSDIDIAVKGKEPLEPEQFSRLAEMFAESDLPIKVDIVDCKVISEAFNKIIDAQNEPLIIG